MLGKQFWRLIEKPNTLFSNVFKGRVGSGSGSSISVWNDLWLPSTCPGPKNKNQHNLYSDLTANQLINETSRTWNLQVLWTLVKPQDVKIIESIPLGRIPHQIRMDGILQKNGRYTIKLGYQVARVYPDRESTSPEFGPLVKHFLWQLISGCIVVKKKLKSRGIQGDIVYARCVFPPKSLFANVDHLFWRVKPEMEDHHFALILWYIWKRRNNKVFSNLDINPRDTFKLAETESLLWAEAQCLLTQGVDQSRLLVNATVPDREIFSGQRWYSTLEGFDGLIGARNTRTSQSPLHSEIKTLIYAMECMRNLRHFFVIFTTNYSQLVNMVSELEE
ncbi:hypothetical protein N665_0016s0007 [Sinapis alba]|nr:hypothetical protein N665_0016s0007 [Sinapis alba]